MPYGSRIEYDSREDAAERLVAAKLRWLPTEELDAELQFVHSPELTAAMGRIRESMSQEATMDAANERRHRDAQAASDLLQQPVIYSAE